MTELLGQKDYEDQEGVKIKIGQQVRGLRANKFLLEIDRPAIKVMFGTELEQNLFKQWMLSQVRPALIKESK